MVPRYLLEIEVPGFRRHGERTPNQTNIAPRWKGIAQSDDRDALVKAAGTFKYQILDREARDA